MSSTAISIQVTNVLNQYRAFKSARLTLGNMPANVAQGVKDELTKLKIPFKVTGHNFMLEVG